MSGKLGTRQRRRLKLALLARDGDSCVWCCRTMVDEPIEPFLDCSLYMTVEHLIPVSLGGSDDLANLALACFSCNNGRGASLDDYTPLWLGVGSGYGEAVVDEAYGGESPAQAGLPDGGDHLG